jgi:DNA processing protein
MVVAIAGSPIYIRRTIEVDGERFECLELLPESLLGRLLNEYEARYAVRRIYVVGRIPIPLPVPRVSVVGTRKPSHEGIEFAKRLVENLVREKVIVMSGLAWGIDTVAHTTAIELVGRTIAVLGTPVNVFYPPENKELQLRLMREHMVISQFPIGSPVTRKKLRHQEQDHGAPLRRYGHRRGWGGDGRDIAGMGVHQA